MNHNIGRLASTANLGHLIALGQFTAAVMALLTADVYDIDLFFLSHGHSQKNSRMGSICEEPMI